MVVVVVVVVVDVVDVVDDDVVGIVVGIVLVVGIVVVVVVVVVVGIIVVVEDERVEMKGVEEGKEEDERERHCRARQLKLMEKGSSSCDNSHDPEVEHRKSNG